MQFPGCLKDTHSLRQTSKYNFPNGDDGEAFFFFSVRYIKEDLHLEQNHLALKSLHMPIL